jgi:hypothetical protein
MGWCVLTIEMNGGGRGGQFQCYVICSPLHCRQQINRCDRWRVSCALYVTAELNAYLYAI